ncbi:MAG: Fic family protein, partial [Acutalibacteraceae bacterium]
ANLEGIAVTYPDTQVICEGMSVAGYTIDEINAVNDLKYAWQYLLENIEEPITLKFMKALHTKLGKFTVINAGSIRWHDVHINGTNWCPELPNEQKIQDNLNDILKISNPIDRALEMFLFCARGQFFYDGNKRLSTLMTNKVMIKNGIGVFSVPIKCHSVFYKLLIDFYETGRKTEIKKFLYDNCIDGVNFD